MQSTVDLIHQQHILPLSTEDKLHLLAEMVKGLANVEDNSSENQKRSLLELEGLGAEIWAGIDPDEYVNALRNEWDHRP